MQVKLEGTIMEPQSTVKSMWVYFDKNLEITTHNKNKRKDHSKPVYPRIQQTEEYFTVFMILYGSQIRMKRQQKNGVSITSTYRTAPTMATKIQDRRNQRIYQG